MLPHVFIDPQDPHPGQMARIGVDEAAGRGDGNTVEQLPAHPECLGRRGDTHSVDCEALEDPAGDPVGHFRSIVGARQRGLEDLPAAGGVGAGEAGNEDVQAGGEPHDREVDEAALDMISFCPWGGAVRACVGDVHWGGVDDGEGADVGGVGDAHTDFCGAA